MSNLRDVRESIEANLDDVPGVADNLHAIFPKTIDQFESDPRVSYSKLDNKWILEDDNGEEWEFDEAHKRWIPSLDEALLAQQQRAYAVEGVDETEEAQPKKKRKIVTNVDDPENALASRAPKKAKAAPTKERRNTAVYVTSLPLDVEIDEVDRVFSRFGVIAEEIDSGKPRIKLYSDDAGNFKGDALIVYHRPESVGLAVQMMDDSDFRLGETGPTGKMSVKEADFSYKKVKGDQPEAKPGMTKDKKKVIKKMEKMNNKLADWDDDDPSAIQETSSRWDKVVVLKHMFTLKELDEDPAAILDIKEDIREECEKLGPVTNVVLYDMERDGVTTVRFGNPEAANACVRLMNGRIFGGQKVEAYISDGSEKFKKSTAKDEGRAEEFGKWLEGEGKEIEKK